MIKAHEKGQKLSSWNQARFGNPKFTHYRLSDVILTGFKNINRLAKKDQIMGYKSFQQVIKAVSELIGHILAIMTGFVTASQVAARAQATGQDRAGWDREKEGGTGNQKEKEERAQVVAWQKASGPVQCLLKFFGTALFVAKCGNSERRRPESHTPAVISPPDIFFNLLTLWRMPRALGPGVKGMNNPGPAVLNFSI